MLLASTTHDMVTFYQELGYILQICYDFESYKTTASSFTTYMKDSSLRVPEIKNVEHKELRASRKV